MAYKKTKPIHKFKFILWVEQHCDYFKKVICNQFLRT